MMLFVMKNELRNPDKNYRQKIQEIFRRRQVQERIETTPVAIARRSNALLYLGMRSPNPTLLGILRMIMKSYDKPKKN